MTADASFFVPPGYQPKYRLGSGQTAHVHLAEHPRHGAVALKVPRREALANPVLRRMFENEVQVTLKLRHERVVRGLEGHPTGEHAYLALEYCPGGTLDQLLLERGRLPMAFARALVRDVVDGLAYTHGTRVLHRDVKPANVFLDGEGRAKLGDFGTGAFLGDGSTERVGTAFYMAPEVFEGQAPTVASDVYSLGVLAFEVLTGERPFRESSYEALMHAHLGGLLRDPSQVRKDLPTSWARVVQRAMARDPAKRFEHVAAMRTTLRDADGEDPHEGASDAPVMGRAGRAAAARPARDEGDDGDDGEEPGGGFWTWLIRRKS